MRATALVMLLAVPLLAQRYEDTVTVNVVDVPVYVERFGVPVRGLTRDDFTLFVDGKPQPIEYFDLVEETPNAESASEGAAAAERLKRRRLVVLLFDTGSSAYALQRSRELALKTIAEARSADSFAVATIGRSGAGFVSAFTTDRIAVQRAIGTLRPSASHDPFRVATLDNERARWGGAVGGAEAGSGTFTDVWGESIAPLALGDSSAGRNALEFQRHVMEMEAREEELANLGFLGTLGALADRLAAVEGVKHVVLLSDRRIAVDGGRIEERLPRASRMQEHISRLHQRYNAAGVILNGVDIRPSEVPVGPPMSTSPWAPSRMPSALTSPFLYDLALETGGVATSSLPQLLVRNSVTYVLGFQARRGVVRGSIRVAVKNLPRLADVRYRKSFDLDAERNGDKGLILADTLLNDIPQNGVTLDLEIRGTQVAASIPGAELLSYPSDKPLQLEVFFYVFDDQGRPFSWNVLELAVDLEKGRDFLSAHPYTMRQELVLQPGRYVVKALVRISGTDRVGFERAEMVVGPS